MIKNNDAIKPFIDNIISISGMIEDKTSNLYKLMKYHGISDDICLYLCQKIVNNSRMMDVDDHIIYATLIEEYTLGGVCYESYPKSNEYIINLFHEYVKRNFSNDDQVIPFKFVSPTTMQIVVNRMCKFSNDNRFILSDECIFGIIGLCFPDRDELDIVSFRKHKERLSFVRKFLKYIDYSKFKNEVISDIVPLIDSYIERDSIKDMVCSDNRYLTMEEKQDFYDSLIREKNYRKLMNDDHA